MLRNGATFSVVTEADKKLFGFPVWGRMLKVYPQGPDGAEQGQFLATRRGGMRYDLGSVRSGEHLRYITQPWFQDDLGVVIANLSRIPGKPGWWEGLQVAIFLTRVLWGSWVVMVQTGALSGPLVKQVSYKGELYEDAGDSFSWCLVKIESPHYLCPLIGQQ